jgi:hypothetical protein
MADRFKRRDDLERMLRRDRPTPPAEFVESLARRVVASPPGRRGTFRLGLAATVTAVLVVSLAAFGGLGYAATSVKHAVHTAVHVVTPEKHHAAKAAGFNSAAAQYGGKVNICVVNPNGKQHTISISENAQASYLRTHPRAYPGSCGAFRPRGAKANVCIRTDVKGKFAAVFVPAGQVQSFLKRNFQSFTTKNGKCK